MPPKLNIHTKKIFATSKDKLHEEHGLNLKGKSPKELGNINAPKGVSFSVFKDSWMW